MREESENYAALEVEDDWIAYLRRRLPYSFLKIRRERRRGRGHRYVLSKPELHAGAEYNNFWRRGYVYYVAGKLMDAYALSDLWIDYRWLRAERTRRGGTGDYPFPMYRAKDYYNAMELEKLWQPVRGNHLDRERVAMTNMSQAMELCLKAVRAHAEYRDSGTFMFEDGHDIGRMFDSLPQPLQDSIVDESRGFAREYDAFRSAVEADVKRLDETPRTEWNWEEIGWRLEGTAYTAILPTGRGKRLLACDTVHPQHLRGVGRHRGHGIDRARSVRGPGVQGVGRAAGEREDRLGAERRVRLLPQANEQRAVRRWRGLARDGLFPMGSQLEEWDSLGWRAKENARDGVRAGG